METIEFQRNFSEITVDNMPFLLSHAVSASLRYSIIVLIPEKHEHNTKLYCYQLTVVLSPTQFTLDIVPT